MCHDRFSLAVCRLLLAVCLQVVSIQGGKVIVLMLCAVYPFSLVMFVFVFVFACGLEGGC